MSGSRRPTTVRTVPAPEGDSEQCRPSLLEPYRHNSSCRSTGTIEPLYQRLIFVELDGREPRRPLCHLAGRRTGVIMHPPIHHRIQHGVERTINGAVVRAAADVGLDVPLSRAMVGLVTGLEQGWARAAA
jgi:hypothetical protein